MGVTDEGEKKAPGLDAERGEELADEALDDVTGGVAMEIAPLDPTAAKKDAPSGLIF
jgi:hypothetical protein